MSRIEDVFKRITGAAADPRQASALDRYAPEGRGEESKVATFVASGPHPVEAKPSVRQKAPAPPLPAAPPPILSAQQTHQAETATEPTASDEKLIDFHQIIDYVGFVVRSLRRHWLLAAGAFTLALGMAVTIGLLLPKTYLISTKLLAQRNAVITSLSNPGRPIPWDADAPTRAAAETVLRRDNLIALIDKTNLVENWKLTREPILRLKDWLTSLVTGYTLTQDDIRDTLIGRLENSMSVTAGPVGDGTVAIDLAWRNPEMGYRLVQEAQQAFLDARAKAETQAIDESIRILEEHAEELSGNITATLAELERTQKGRAAGAAVRRGMRQPSRLSPTSAGDLAVPSLAAAMGLPTLGDVLDTDPDVARIGATIVSKKQEIARLESDKERQVTELRATLERLTQTYTSSYPDVITTQRRLDNSSQDSPQLAALRKDVERLERDLKQRQDENTDRQIQAALERHADTPTPTPTPSPAATPKPAEPPAFVQAPVESPVGSDATDFATLRLRSELNQYESVLERTASAKIELTVSQAAFKYRYTVIRPAELPKDPIQPNLNGIFIAGFAASLMMAVLAAVGRDVLSNRILEAWQIERQLGLRVLGTLETA